MSFVSSQRGQNLLTRLSWQMSAQFKEAGFWGINTIYQTVAGHSNDTPNAIAIRDSYASLTYGDLLQLAEAVASDLNASGLRPGDRVAAWLSNRVEKAAFLIACSRNGYVLCPSLHRNHTTEEILELLNRMNAKAFVGEVGFGANAHENDIFSAPLAGSSVKRVFKLKPPSNRTITDIYNSLELKKASLVAPVADADSVVYLAFTSGTTGEPKGVMHSNNTLLATARSLAKDWHLRSSSVVYTMSPLSHNLGFGAFILAMLIGGQLVLHDLPRGKSLLERFRETGATFLFGVPAHAIDLLQEIEQEGEANLPELRGFRISGASVPSQIVERLLSFGIIPQSGYGMTEAGSHHYTKPTDDVDVIVNTSGRACAGYEVQIFSTDDRDEPVEPGAIGHIGGRGASLMLGYFDDQAATESSFNKSGWFMTGDLGKIEANGCLVITGRIKEIIIRGGHNVHPAKIEMLAMRHEAVERAAVVPVKDERLGEKVCIVVMPRQGHVIDPSNLLSHLHAEGLSRYDMPEYYIEVGEIPLSASGKMLKKEIVPMIADGKLVPKPVRWGGA